MYNRSIDDIATEALIAIRAEQPSGERNQYFSAVLESVTTDTKGNILQKLYDGIIKKSNIDFGYIPLSKGDFTDFKDYETITQAIGYLETLFEGKKVPEFELTKQLYDFLIQCRTDFEFGFKFDIDLIKLTYNTSIFTLLDMIDLCVMGYVNYLKDTKSIEIKFGKVEADKLFFVNVAETLVALYSSGEWAKFMKGFKKNPNALIGKSFVEAFLGEKGFGSMMNGSASGAKGGIKAILNALDWVPTPIKAIVLTIAGTFILLWILRRAIGAYFETAARLNDKLKCSKQFVEANMKIENDVSAYERQEKLARSLASTSNFIEVKILKANTAAVKETKDCMKELNNTVDETGAPTVGNEPSIVSDTDDVIEF